MKLKLRVSFDSKLLSPCTRCGNGKLLVFSFGKKAMITCQVCERHTPIVLIDELIDSWLDINDSRMFQ